MGKKDGWSFAEIFMIVFLVILSVAFTYYFQNQDNEEEISQVCFDDVCFSVEVAGSDDERRQGLMFRESLGEQEGMLFVFDSPGVYPFWMKNTLIPLDIIWIDEKLEVVAVMSAEPCEEDPCLVHNPKENALYVLEINKGAFDSFDLKLGDRVKFK